MGADLVVVGGGVSLEDAAQVRSPNTTVRIFAPDPIRRAVRRVRSATASAPQQDDRGCPWRNASGVAYPEGAVAITNQITWSFVPRKGFGHLTRDPFRRQIAGHSNLTRRLRCGTQK